MSQQFVPSGGPVLPSSVTGKVKLVAGSAVVAIAGAVGFDHVFLTYESTLNAGTILEGRISAPGILTITSNNPLDASDVAFLVIPV